MNEHIFGYASLVAAPAARRLVSLLGHRRFWGVAMDNRVALPGYKVYEAPDGRRPPVAVAFLDLAPAPDTAVDGALLAVDHHALAALDARERQYRRADVTAAIRPAPPAGARVWTYVGREEGRERVRRGRAGGGPVVIQRAYADLVDRAFRALGPERHGRYLASTEAPPFPLRDLARIELGA